MCIHVCVCVHTVTQMAGELVCGPNLAYHLFLFSWELQIAFTSFKDLKNLKEVQYFAIHEIFYEI